MAITIQYPANPLLAGQAAYQAGYGQYAQQQRQQDRQWAMQNAQFAYDKFNQDRQFDESRRRFGMQFGETQRQQDIDNAFRDVAMANEQAQFAAQQDFRYDAMAQEASQRVQQMAMEQARLSQQKQLAYDQMQQQMAGQRWNAYQNLESQRMAAFYRQGQAEFDKLSERDKVGNWRTPEQQIAAWNQWEERFGEYLPAPINIGDPPQPTEPWDTIPQRPFTLPDGSEVMMFARPDGKGGWIPDASMANIQIEAIQNEKKAAIEEEKKKSELAKKEREAEIKTQSDWSKMLTSLQTDGQKRRTDHLAAEVARVNALRDAEMKQYQKVIDAAATAAATEQKGFDRIAELDKYRKQVENKYPLPDPEAINRLWTAAEGMMFMRLPGIGGGEPVTEPPPQPRIEALPPLRTDSDAEIEQAMSELAAQGKSGAQLPVYYQGKLIILTVP